MLRTHILILYVNFRIILIVFSYEFLLGFPGKIWFGFVVQIDKLSLLSVHWGIIFVTVTTFPSSLLLQCFAK